MVFLGWHNKAGVHHAQWAQDVLLQEGPETLAADHFNQRAQQIGRAAVFPNRAGLEPEGDGGQCLREFAVVAVA